MTRATIAAAAAAAVEARPRLRGWLHAAMVPVALLGAWELIGSGSGGPSRASLAVFCACMVGLYTTSSLYHLPRWSARARWILSRFDVAMIQLFIAGTFTPIAFHTMSGAWRLWSLVVAWGVAIIGAGIAASPLRGPRWLGAAGYLAVGWLGVVPLTRIIAALPWEGTGLISLGGLLYTVGAIVYVRRKPDPLPRWFGYHEVFHLLVIAASICHWLAIWRYVIPAA